MWCAPADTHAPSRSFSTASCAVGQSRPAPATRIFSCPGHGLRRLVERLLDRVGQPADVLAVQRRERGDRARVARGVAPGALELRRADDDLLGELGERGLGGTGDEPLRPREDARSLERQRGRALVRDADHQIGLGRREHRLERLHRRPAGLRGVERRAAAGEHRTRALRQPPTARHATQPLGLREQCATCLARHCRSLYHRARCPCSNASGSTNGLRVLTAPLPHAQSVACFVMLAAGSRYERAENRGIAHFAEHMFFKGTERRPSSRDLTTLIDGIGGEFNAFTSKEYTGYYVRCAGADRDIAFDVLLDMLRHSKFDPEEIEREKGVILEEMNMYQDTPRDHIGTVYEDADVRRQPARLGDARHEGDDQGRDRDTFVDYVDEWYTPDRMVVGVSGMVGDDLRPCSRSCSATWPGNGASRRSRRPSSTARRARTSTSTTRTPTRPTSSSASRATRSSTPTGTRCRCSSAVLGSGMSSRLFLEVRERRGLAYYVHGDEPLLHRRGLAARPGRRRHRRGSTRRSR